MPNEHKKLQGLTSQEAKELQNQYGKNELTPQKKESFFKKVIHIICEPMFLLLIVAALIYFVLGEPRDGAIMLVFVVVIIGIDVVQEWKTDKTLNALKDLSAPHISVIRDGAEQSIASADLVPGDIMLLQEGVKIPADGFVLHCNDLCVDESSLTGEAEGVWKVSAEEAPADDALAEAIADMGMEQKSGEEHKDYWRKDYCYAGTLVTQGSAYVRVDKIGTETEYGKIGANIAAAPEEKTPLQKQTGSLVKLCAGIAAVFFALVVVATYLNLSDLQIGNRIVQSILSGITIAMAMIPEEFPVVLTVFLSLGAWRLAKKKSLVRKLPAVETLGAVSVLCVDKTGTITMNQMTVQATWPARGDENLLLATMGKGCESDPYDPMEKAMLRCCEQNGMTREDLFGGELVYEYSFTNELKMMGHVWRNADTLTVAAKGSPERILELCHLSEEEWTACERKQQEMASEGLRVIAVASMDVPSEAQIPPSITDCALTLQGLVGLADPPRESVKTDIERCHQAGIRVVMITGDNGNTAAAIANKIGMHNTEHIITGDMLSQMSDEELREQVKTVNIFSRVIPEHKMRIVKAFKDNGEIVAMTGDGVNDAPALKYADIGIAMGERGSEVSREAADLILLDDNFTTIVETVRDGRRIYDNIRKAIGYIFTIHIPIAFASLFAPLLGIVPAAVFLLPLHVVLMELVIDPTCSIVLERQPAERDIMQRKPRGLKEKIMTPSLLIKSIVQGIVLFAASFGTYLVVMNGNPDNAPAARAMGIVVIMIANIFLVQVNSSTNDFAVQTFVRLIKDKVMWAINIVTIVVAVIIIYTPLADFLKLAPLSAGQFFAAVGIGAASVLWFEIVKVIKKLTKRNAKTT